MNFFVAVVFFCVPGDCSFWKADQVFNSLKECEKVLTDALDVLETNSDMAAGACMKIRMARV